jgi:UPF0755 protein
MQPNTQPPKKPVGPRQIDGIKLPPVRPQASAHKSPEYRYDHELPAPQPHELLTAQGTPDAPQASVLVQQPPKKRSKLKIFFVSLFVLALLAIAAGAAAFWWYQEQLKPVSSVTDNARVRVTIESGSTPSMIAELLKQKQLIRDATAFVLYTQLSGTGGSLKAGSYTLQPNESVVKIVEHLTTGKVDEFSLTFLPGDTLANHRKRIIAAGYSESDVDAALKKTYSHPVLATKPASADLEGYIYGETYRFASSASVEDILVRTFDELETQIVNNGLVAAYKKQNLTLYQGITLASIIQREVPTAVDQKQTAQIFLLRLRQGMMLGSDVTYHYAADKMGVQRDYRLDSPYNTRKYTGLPPGPIASPGLSALIAVAQPASGDYVYFLSGDDDKTYFARTNAEHEQNIIDHCTVKCTLP